MFTLNRFDWKVWSLVCHSAVSLIYKLEKRNVYAHSWNSNFWRAKTLLLKHCEDDILKYITNMSQGPPNPGFRSVKVENSKLKKDSQDFKNSFQFWFLWIPGKSGEQSKKVTFFDFHNRKKNGVRFIYTVYNR